MIQSTCLVTLFYFYFETYFNQKCKVTINLYEKSHNMFFYYILNSRTSNAQYTL